MSDSSTNSPNPAIPTGAQLAESRLKQWHQQGEALLTLENLRSWINAAGLVLFAPRPQIVSPAPSLVEAVLGASNPNPTLAQTVEARSLLARLVAEGLAVPLNLLGATNGVIGETPDFVASTAVFSYVFTLRGDKAWKQPPETTGALKVSHLALATHEALANSKTGPLSAYDLTTEVGKEVTEAAVLRALGELWTHLRVLPLPQPDGKPTLWELASTRFTKQIKAGANAGQPSALSALISLYLGQAIVASEEEIESYLSPLASRSRIRDVIHALLAARQLETIAVEGRTMLHVTGELPAFLAPSVVEAKPDEIAVDIEAPTSETGEAAPRITKYVPKPRKIGTGYLAKASPSKFGARPSTPSKFGASKPASRFGKPTAKPGFKSTPAPDRERRPFVKPAIDYAARGFDKPWEEEKARRLAAVSKPSDVETTPVDLAATEAPAETQPRAPRVYKPREDSGDRRGFGSKPPFRGKPSFGDKPSFGRKPSFGDSRPPRRDFAPRAEGDSTDSRPPRKTFSKPGTFGRKREGFAGKPSFGDARPPRSDFAPRGDRPAFGASRAPGSFAPRPKSDRPGGFKSDRPGGFKSDRAPRGEGSSFAPRKPYPPRGAGFFSGQPRAADNRGDRPARPDTGPRERPDRSSTTESGKRVYRKFDAPRERPDRPARPYSSDRPARPFSSDRPSKPNGDFAPRKFSGKPTGRPGAAAGRPSGKPGGGKKPFGKPSGSFTGKPESTFAKFAGNKKPFGKRPPARKFKPNGGESA